jgi:hemoglobin/transferrin/lactoferrin receptor protein
MIRGFATNRLLYSVDGVRMNTAIFRGGNIQNVISLDPLSIESTEVFFGPGSVIYGSDAIGGVMSFQTLTPQFAIDDQTLINGKAFTRYATANEEVAGHFNLNVGGEKWALASSITATKYGDLRMGSHGPDDYLRPFYVERINGQDVVIDNQDPLIQNPSGYSQINLMQKLSYQPNKNWDLRYGFHLSETSGYSRYDRHIRLKEGLPRYGEWRYGPQKWSMNHLEVKHKKRGMLYEQLSLRMAQQFFEESRISRDIQSEERENRIEKVDALSVNIDLTKATGLRNQFYYGFEAVWNGVESTANNENINTGFTTPGPSRYPQADWVSLGAYINDQFEWSDALTLQAGLRYSYFMLDARFDTTFYPLPFTKSELNNAALTGSFGVVWRPAKQWIIKSKVSTGYRSPNVDDIGKIFDSEPGAVVVPNPDLDSEYAYNADLGITRIFDKRLRIDLTAYYTFLQNAMVRRNFTLNGMDSIWYDGTFSQVQAIQNAAVARVYGIQGSFELKLLAGFGLSADLNYQLGEEELDDGSVSPSRHAAPLFGNMRLSYRAQKLSMQWYVLFNDEKSYAELPVSERGKAYLYASDSEGNPYAPSWYTLNFKAMYQLEDHIQISAGVENLTDQRYRPYSSGIAAPGRNFILSMKYGF